MIQVRLKNPNLIIIPISNEEKEQCEKDFMGDENIYVLYRLPNLDEIQIGMMSSTIRKCSPSVANISQLDSATSKSFFYSGAGLNEKDMKLTSRPIYRVIPSNNRTVVSYEILNGTLENGLSIPLEDVVDGKYAVDVEKPTINQKR